jgi:CHAD domain-containing protein
MDSVANADPAITSDVRAARAMRAIHRRMLRSLQANEAGTLEGKDPEFLHEFRVAIRRTRCALNQVKKVFPEDRVQHFRREFKWLGDVTGPVRDLDVHLLDLEDHRQLLAPEQRPHLDPVQEFLRYRLETAREDLLRSLSSERYHRLLEDWGRFLTAPTPMEDAPVNAGRPISEVASARLRRAYGRVLDLGRQVDADTPDEVLHDLRIEGKKLRYLLEFFRGLYDQRPTTRFVRSLKDLQNNLGRLNDVHVQQEALRDDAQQISFLGPVRVNTMLAVGMLLQLLDKDRLRARRQFGKLFSRFARRDNRELFERLLRRPAGGRKEGAA